MLDVLLIRPGCTNFDEAGRIKGSLDIPLSATGLAQAQKLALALKTQKLDCLYVAPCLSARLTAEQIGEMNFCKQRSLAWLRNLDHGLWQGKLQAEVKRLQPTFYRQFQENPQQVGPPGGENVQQVVQRIQGPLNKLLRKHAGGRVGILVSDPLASILQCLLTGDRLGDIWQLERDSGTLNSIMVHSLDGQPELQLA